MKTAGRSTTAALDTTDDLMLQEVGKTSAAEDTAA